MKHIKVLAGITRDVLVYSLLPILAAIGLLYVVYRTTGAEAPLWVETFTGDLFALAVVLAWFWFYQEESIRTLFTERLTLKKTLILIPASFLIRVAVVSVFILLALFPEGVATALLASLNRAVEIQWEGFEEVGAMGRVLGFVSMVLLAPISEELFYRGIIYRKLLVRYSPAISIVLSAIVFALGHLHPGLYLSTFIIGIAFAWVYQRWNNLAYSIILHMLINLHPFIIELFI